MINIAIGRERAIAVRRLHNSDTVITFRNGTKGYYTKNIDQVIKAFGKSVEIAQRTYMVLTKGVLKTLVKGVNMAELVKTITKTNNTPIT